MTVGSQVKSCYSSMKAAEASLEILINKTQSEEAKQAYKKAAALTNEIKADLKKQVLFLAKEEPQYK